MNFIKSKKILNNLTTSMTIDAPLIASKAKAGQFIILKISETGERIPLTISDFDREKGTITIIYQKVGKTTYLLDKLNEGDFIQDVVGPLGKPTNLEGYKRFLLIAGGTGTAIIYPQAKAIKEMDKTNKVDIISGFKNKDLIILEEEMSKICDDLVVMTDDGSYGKKGFVTEELKKKLSNDKYDLVIAIGPLPMMKAVSEITKEFNTKTIVSMNPIMIDGTGMCGGCRVKVNGKFKFACIDGPDFDGHEVDFDDTINRLKTYEKIEREDSCNLFNLTTDGKENDSSDKEQEEKYLNKEQKDDNNKKTKAIEQSPETRQHNFSEVSLGYDEELAKKEASRCLGCKKPSCVSGCPVNIDIPKFINYIKNDDYMNAYMTITESNALPAICGRVCPQEKQCESKCIRGIKGEPVGIGYLERFVADWYFNNKKDENIKKTVEKNGKKVAIVGSGPSGLTCAAELIKLGYDVTVFEALHKPGGVLSYGIPEFRLPKDIVEKEIDSLKNNGVEFETNTIIGKTLTVNDLWDQNFSAIYIASGAGLPKFMGIEGEQLIGVYSANEFLTRINLMKAYKENYDTPILKSNSIAVIGGGNVAMDAARCAKRLGAKNVYIVYRRSEKEMPARLEEINHAKEEDIEFKLLSNPIEILGNQNKVNGLKCVKMMLSEPDESGRKSVIPIENSEFVIEVDSVVIAIGNVPNPIVKDSSFGISTKDNGCIIIDENSMTSKDLIFAGGDAVSGAATVILAMEAGKKAAHSIDEKLSR